MDAFPAGEHYAGIVLAFYAHIECPFCHSLRAMLQKIRQRPTKLMAAVAAACCAAVLAGTDADHPGGHVCSPTAFNAAKADDQAQDSPRCSTQQAALQSELHDAAARGDVATLHRLLQQGVPVSAAADGTTALHKAAAAGHGEAVKMLLAAGADANAPRRDGATPLTLAAGSLSACNCPEVIKLLVCAGARLTSTDSSSSVLHTAAGQGRLKALQALLDAGCDPGVLDRHGYSPLRYAVCYRQVEAAAMLLSAGAPLDQQSGHRASLLAQAAFTGCEPMVRLLVEKGADPALAIYQEAKAKTGEVRF